MSDLRILSRTFITEFIQLYQCFPCLWKTKSKEYIDRNKKNEAYKILLTKLQEVEKNATKESVKTKINTLRGGFRRELKKILSSKRSGAGADDVYVPNLWYYDLLLFVKDQEIPRESITNVPKNSDNAENAEEFNEQQNEMEENADLDNDNREDFSALPSPSDSIPVTNQTETTTSTILTKRSIASTSTPTMKQKRKKCQSKPEEQTDDILTMVGERLRTSTREDEFSIFGKHIAIKLRGLPRESRLYAEKLINEILFEAEMGNIDRQTKIITSFQSPHSSYNYPLNVGLSRPPHLTLSPQVQNSTSTPSYTVLQTSTNISEPSYHYQHHLNTYHQSSQTQHKKNPTLQSQETHDFFLPPSSTDTPANISQDVDVVSFINNFTTSQQKKN